MSHTELEAKLHNEHEKKQKTRHFMSKVVEPWAKELFFFLFKKLIEQIKD